MDVARYYLAPRVTLRYGMTAPGFLILLAGCEIVGGGGLDLPIGPFVFLVVIGVIFYKIVKRVRGGRRRSKVGMWWRRRRRQRFGQWVQ